MQFLYLGPRYSPQYIIPMIFPFFLAPSAWSFIGSFPVKYKCAMSSSFSIKWTLLSLSGKFLKRLPSLSFIHLKFFFSHSLLNVFISFGTDHKATCDVHEITKRFLLSSLTYKKHWRTLISFSWLEPSVCFRKADSSSSTCSSSFSITLGTSEFLLLFCPYYLSMATLDITTEASGTELELKLGNERSLKIWGPLKSTVWQGLWVFLWDEKPWEDTEQKHYWSYWGALSMVSIFAANHSIWHNTQLSVSFWVGKLGKVTWW